MAREGVSRPAALASHVLLILVGITMLLPFLWMVGTSLKGEGEVFQHNVIPEAIGLGAEGTPVRTRDGKPVYAAVAAAAAAPDTPEHPAWIRGDEIRVHLGTPVQQGSSGERAAMPDGESLSDDLGIPAQLGNILRDGDRAAELGSLARFRDPRAFDKYAEVAVVERGFTAPGFDAQANEATARAWFCERPGRYRSDAAWEKLVATRFGGCIPLMLDHALSDEWASHSGKAEPVTIGGVSVANRNPKPTTPFYQFKNLSWGQPGQPVRDKTLAAVLCRASGEAVRFTPAFPVFRTEDDALKADERSDLMVFVGDEPAPRTIAGRELALTRHARFVWSNYQTVLTDPNVKMTLFAWNSLFISVSVVLLQILTSSLAAFAFSRLDWKGRDVVFLAYLGTMMVPAAITMIPNYLILQKLGWLNSFKGLILPAAASAYGTFMLRQYMLTLPKGLEEAARIDGASVLRVWWDIIMPLCKPAVITLAIFTFGGTWMSFTWPLIVAPDEQVRVLPVALQQFSSGQSTAYSLLMAASLVMMLPMLILFVFGQKYFVRGIQLGGVKG